MQGSFFSAFMLLLAAAASGADRPAAWPQFRGPDGSSVADDQNPPVEFGPEKNLKWKVSAPGGFSSPIVVADKLVITAFDDGKLYTIAYNRGDGKEAWRAQAPAGQIEAFHPTEGSPAASTPASDGQRIVSYFGSCGLFCYDLAGKELWKLELPMVRTAGDFGTGVSPVIADGLVVLVRDEISDPKLLAVDLATGRIRWEQKRHCNSGFCTPVIWNTDAGRQIAVPGSGRMIGYDLRTGDEKWSVAGMPSACCASPVVADGLLFFAGWSPGDPEDKEAGDFKFPTFDSVLQEGDTDGDGVLSRAESEKTSLKGFFNSNDTNKDGFITRAEWDEIAKFLATSRNSAFALKPGGAGDITKSHVLWQKTTGLPYVPSAVLYQGQYVIVKDGGIVTAYDAKTGRVLHQGRSVVAGRYYASPVAAGGRIYFASLDEGAVTVLKAGTAKAEVLAKNPPLEERIAATPAIADNTLYIRTAGHLYAFAGGN